MEKKRHLIELDRGIKKMVQVKDKNVMNVVLDAAHACSNYKIITPQGATVVAEDFKRKEAVGFSLFKGVDFRLKNASKAGNYYNQLMQGAKGFSINREEWPVGSGKGIEVVGPIVTAPEEYQLKMIKMWEYDINSAYLYVLAHEQMPNVNFRLPAGIIEEGQCGWIINSEGKVEYQEVGSFAIERYYLMDSPWQRWALRQYQLLREAKEAGNKERADEIKTIGVVAIGVLKNQCFPLGAWIYHKNRQRLLSFGDENTVAYNTDCLYSLTKREDLPLSKQIGDFKEESGTFFWRGTNYTRMEDGKKVLRGIGGMWQESYDILSGECLKTPDYKYYGGKII